MKILGIETSCDETAAAVVEDGAKILSNVVATSAEMHAKTGGVIPEEAARQQVKSIIPVIREALGGAGESLETIDKIAVTVGPGLIGSLLVGVETAKTLAHLYKKPIIPVNHLVAHLYANWLGGKMPSFPALALVVSGGHTDMVLISDHGKIEWLGGTRDDAAGEAFDKTARLLGLPYPGGPQISKLAEKFKMKNPNHIYDLFPRPMIKEKNFDFSFSGLKTAVIKEVSKMGPQVPKEQLAAEVQEAIAEVLVEKALVAAIKFRPKSLLLAGGVAANLRLREKFESEIKSRGIKIDFFVPQPKLCTDNAAYIAAFAFFNSNPIGWEKIQSNPELTIDGQV